jgi:hypothetical protein
MNLMEGLLQELNRNKELLSEYKEIGPAGAFGAIFIDQDIKFAEYSIIENDVIKMLQAYEKLKENN